MCRELDDPRRLGVNHRLGLYGQGVTAVVAPNLDLEVVEPTLTERVEEAILLERHQHAFVTVVVEKSRGALAEEIQPVSEWFFGGLAHQLDTAEPSGDTPIAVCKPGHGPRSPRSRWMSTDGGARSSLSGTALPRSSRTGLPWRSRHP